MPKNVRCKCCYTVVKPITDAREARTRNFHEIECALFDARNLREKYFAASRYDTYKYLAQVSRMSFSYMCHGLYEVCIACGDCAATRAVSMPLSVMQRTTNGNGISTTR